MGGKNEAMAAEENKKKKALDAPRSSLLSMECSTAFKTGIFPLFYSLCLSHCLAVKPYLIKTLELLSRVDGFITSGAQFSHFDRRENERE